MYNTAHFHTNWETFTTDREGKLFFSRQTTAGKILQDSHDFYDNHTSRVFAMAHISLEEKYSACNNHIDWLMSITQQQIQGNMLHIAHKKKM